MSSIIQLYIHKKHDYDRILYIFPCSRLYLVPREVDDASI